MKKENIKLIILTFCLLLLGLEIFQSLGEVKTLMQKPITGTSNLEFSFDIDITGTNERGVSYETLHMLIQKILELIFLVPGFFMTLTFISINNIGLINSFKENK